MKPSRRARLESQLSAYLDGELAPVERREVEELLQTDAGARTLLQELQAAAGLLRDLPRAAAGPGLVEGVRKRLERKALLGDPAAAGPAPEPPVFSRGRGLAAAAVIALTVTTGYLIWAFREPPGGELVRQTIDAGRRSESADRDGTDSPLVLARARSDGAVNLQAAAPLPDRGTSPTAAPPAESSPRLQPDEAAASDATAASVARSADTAGTATGPPPDAMREHTLTVELAYADISSRNRARQLLSDRHSAGDAPSATALEETEAGDAVLVEVPDAAGVVALLAELGRTRPLTMKLIVPSETEQSAPTASRAVNGSSPHPAREADTRGDEGSTEFGFLELAHIEGYVERLRRALQAARLQRRSRAPLEDSQQAQASVPADTNPAPLPAEGGEPPRHNPDVPEPQLQVVTPEKGMSALMVGTALRPREVPMASAPPPATGPAAAEPDIAAPADGSGLRVRIRWMAPEDAPATVPAAR